MQSVIEFRSLPRQGGKRTELGFLPTIEEAREREKQRKSALERDMVWLGLIIRQSTLSISCQY